MMHTEHAVLVQCDRVHRVHCRLSALQVGAIDAVIVTNQTGREWGGGGGAKRGWGVCRTVYAVLVKRDSSPSTLTVTR